MYQPSTEIRIGTVPWNPNYKHVRWYPNLNAQMGGHRLVHGRAADDIHVHVPAP